MDFDHGPELHPGDRLSCEQYGLRLAQWLARFISLKHHAHQASRFLEQIAQWQYQPGLSTLATPSGSEPVVNCALLLGSWLSAVAPGGQKVLKRLNA